ncbi:hypothetical protein PHM2_104 [Prochlorococcus phage P-HM2]|uniref:Uncharacterized protein n=1 Tax=Prochlorococcus phage P-HM2 TaxID=445696 RepID=E3SSV4_9CAUD|nr:hypothetical protein PHM2_104 [Prochlorococcus phage P-HM2]ADO99882.1 hypothetical protein PHM2_104 [Prochlorococcus phage P-HM2]|tara:strand:- start:681 stop:869 length:189 start_codon:yes stop_codon:yes gene_type:complete
MDIEGMVKEFTDQLKDQKATIVELEKQLSTRKEQVLRLEGAIEALNMTLKKPEETDGTEEVK